MARIGIDDEAVKRIVERRIYNKQAKKFSQTVKRRSKMVPVEKEKRETNIIDILGDEAWAGRRCFIIGGGPSLIGFDFTKLVDDITIGINAAYLKIDPTILLSMDRRFCEWANAGAYGKTEIEKKQLIKRYENLTSMKARVSLEPASFDGVFNIHCNGAAGLSESIHNGVFHGENSGYCALNLAYILGCNPIYLLGFDMSTGKQAHWHDGHPARDKSVDMKTFFYAFKRNAAAIKSKTRVINLNRDSELKCFEFGDFPGLTKKPVIVSLFNSETKSMVGALRRCLWKFGLRHKIEVNDNITKPEFIKKMMVNHNRDIVWLDNDAQVTSYPEEVFSFKGDYGTFEHPLCLNRELKGLAYYKNNAAGKALIEALKEDKIEKVLKNWSGKMGHFLRKGETAIPVNIKKTAETSTKSTVYENIKYDKSWILISYYTEGTSYEEEIKKLKQSLENYKIDYCFYGEEALGSWRKNLNHKSRVIREAMSKYKDKDIVFVDSDAIIKKYPALFDELSSNRHYNIATCFRCYRGSVSPGSLLSGTLWFRNDKAGREIVDRWHDIAIKNEDVRHQHCLRLALEEIQMQGNFLLINRLPNAYTYVYNYKYDGNVIPVIMHYQASRKLRKEVGETLLRDSSFTAKQGGYVK